MEIVRTNKYRLYPCATLHEMFGLFRFTFNNTLGKIQNLVPMRLKMVRIKEI